MNLQSRITQARQRNFTDEEILDVLGEDAKELAPRIQAAKQRNFSPAEILEVLSEPAKREQIRPSEMNPLQRGMNVGIYANKPAPTFYESLKQGFAESATGRLTDIVTGLTKEEAVQQEMEETFRSNPGFAKSLVKAAGTLGGDIGAFLAGRSVGTTIGATTGTPIGAAIMGDAMAMAAPTGIKELAKVYRSYVASDGKMAWDEFVAQAKEGFKNVHHDAALGSVLGMLGPILPVLKEVPWLGKFLQSKPAKEIAEGAIETGVLQAAEFGKTGEVSMDDLAMTLAQVAGMRVSRGAFTKLQHLREDKSLQMALKKAPAELKETLTDPETTDSKFEKAIETIIVNAEKEKKEAVIKIEKEEGQKIRETAKKQQEKREAAAAGETVEEAHKRILTEEQSKANEIIRKKIEKQTAEREERNKKVSVSQRRSKPTPEEEAEIAAIQDKTWEKILKRQTEATEEHAKKKGVGPTAEDQAQIKAISDKALEEKVRKQRKISEETEKRIAEARKTGIVTIEEGLINPESKTPDKETKIRYVPRAPEDAGKTSLEVVKERVKPVVVEKTPGIFRSVGTKIKEAYAEGPLKYIERKVFNEAAALRGLERKSDVTGLQKAYTDMRRVGSRIGHNIEKMRLLPGTQEEIAKSLKHALKESLPADWAASELDALLAARSSIDAQNVGHINPIPTEDAIQLQKDLAHYNKAVKEIAQWLHQDLVDGERTGFYSPEEVEAMERVHSSYAPLHRLMEQQNAKISDPTASFAGPISKPLKKTKGGSEQAIESPLFHIIQNHAAMQKAIARNNLASRIGQALVKEGYTKQGAELPKTDYITLGVDPKTPEARAAVDKAAAPFAADAFTDGKGTLYFWEGGKRQAIKNVPEPYIQMLRAPKQAGALLKGIGSAVRWFSSIQTVYEPVRLITIGAKDVMVMTTSARTPFLGAIETYMAVPRAVFSAFKKDKLYDDYVRSGLQAHGWRGMSRENQAEMTMTLTEGLGSKDSVIQKHAENKLRGIGRFMRYVSNTFSDATRIAALRAEMASSRYRGLSHEEALKRASASVQERITSFDNRGSSEIVQQLPELMMFFNSTVQSGYTLFRNAAKYPVATISNGLTAIGIPAMLGNMQVYDDPRYEKLPLNIRDNNFIFKPYFGLFPMLDDGKQPLWMFSYPWAEGQVYGNLPVKILEFMRGSAGEEETKEGLQRWVGELFHQLSPIGNPLSESSRLPFSRKYQDVIPSEIYEPETSQVARKISEGIDYIGLQDAAKALNINPITIDRFSRQFISPLTRQGAAIVDEFLYYMDLAEDKRPEGHAVLNSWFGQFARTGKNAHITKFYELANKQDSRAANYRIAQEHGNAKLSKEILDAGPIYKTRRARMAMSTLAKEVTRIHNYPLSQMSAHEKKKRLQEVADRMDELAAYYINEMKANK